MPNRWLLKSDPDDYSYDDLARDGRAVWDGVANAVALRNIRSMKKGDAALVYATGEEKAVIGLAEVASDPYPDPKEKDERLVVFELVPKKRLARPVTLKEIKADPFFADWALVRVPRLSVMPVTDEQWKRVLEKAERPGA